MSRHITDARVAQLRSLTLATLWFGTSVGTLAGTLWVPFAPAVNEALKSVWHHIIELIQLSKTGLTHSECMEYCEDYGSWLDDRLDVDLVRAERVGYKFGRRLQALDKELRALCERPDLPDGLWKNSRCVHKLSRWYSDVLAGTCVF